MNQNCDRQVQVWHLQTSSLPVPRINSVSHCPYFSVECPLELKIPNCGYCFTSHKWGWVNYLVTTIGAGTRSTRHCNHDSTASVQRIITDIWNNNNFAPRARRCGTSFWSCLLLPVQSSLYLARRLIMVRESLPCSHISFTVLSLVGKLQQFIDILDRAVHHKTCRARFCSLVCYLLKHLTF